MPCCRGWASPSSGAWRGQPRPNRPHLQAGWVPTLRYTSLGGAKHTSSVTEVAEWVQTLAPPDTSPPYTPPPTLPPPSPQRRQRPHPAPPTPVLPPLLVTPPPTLPSPSSQRRRSPRLQALLSSVSAPTTAPPCVLPCPRRLKPRRGRAAALLLLRYSRAAWQGVDACG